MKNRNRISQGLHAGLLLGIASASMGWMVVANAEEGEGHMIPHQVGGINIEGGITWFLQQSDGAIDDTAALSYTLDLALEGRVSDHGKLIVALEAGDGEGIDPFVGALSATNYDAFYSELTDSVNGSTNVVVPSVSQAYYEGEYLGSDLIFSVGKLDVHSMFDDNAYANDETDQFMSAIFTRSPDTTYAQLDYYYAPGIAAQYAMSDKTDLTLIAANGNKGGFNDVFNNLYVVAQINIKPQFGGRDGNYRLYVLSDDRDSTLTSFTKISDGKKAGNTAWGLSFDQSVYDGIGLFARYSIQDDGIAENIVASSWSLGALFEGVRWGRAADSIGIGYGSVNLNDKADLASALGTTDTGDETHLEVFYKIGYSEHFTLTGDVQVVGNNGGDAAADTVTVAGVRGQLNF